MAEPDRSVASEAAAPTASGRRPAWRQPWFVILLCAVLIALGVYALSPNLSEDCTSEKFMHHEIDTNFIEWSNSVPMECAEIQLKEFFATFDSLEELKAWLLGKGFSIGIPIDARTGLPIKPGRSSGKTDIKYSIVASWDVKRNGTLFAHGLLESLGSLFVYGVTVAVIYGSEFEIYRVSISKTIE